MGQFEPLPVRADLCHPCRDQCSHCLTVMGMGRGTELLEGCFCRLDGALHREGGCEGLRG